MLRAEVVGDVGVAPVECDPIAHRCVSLPGSRPVPSSLVDVSGFYDRLAGAYHLIYADWRKAVARQGAVLDRLLRTYLSDGPHRVLDCTCGIGTQAIGLATRGHSVHGTDLSAASVERAAREAATFGVSPTFGVADVRALERDVTGEFDAVITCDNSLPHLLTDDELDAAARNMRAK